MPKEQVIQGARNTVNINQDRRKVDMANAIDLLQPSKSPFMVLTKKLGTRTVTNPIFHWLEDDLLAKWVTVKAQAEAGANEIELAEETPAKLLSEGAILKVPKSGEILRVIKVDEAANKVTVLRGTGTTEAAEIAADSAIVVLGSAFQENSRSGNPVTRPTETLFNYTQIFRTPLEVSATQEASALFGGSDRNYQRKKKGIEHAIDLERTAWFGERSEDVKEGNVVRTTGGILSFINEGAHRLDAKNKLDEDTFETGFLEQLFRYGSGTKYLFCSSRALSVINSWGRDKIRLDVGANKLGLKVYNYTSAHGDLKLIRHHLFEGDVYGKMAVALDLNEGDVMACPLKGRNTTLHTNIQPKDQDGYKDEYITEMGFQIKAPKKHGIITNIDFGE